MKRLLIVFAFIGMLMTGCIKEKRTGADLEAGDSLPEFSVIMNDGTVVSDVGMYGNVSVIMFFHTSCKDCREVLPVMQKIYDEYAGKEVRFAFISRNEDNDEIMAYWRENGFKMPYSAQNDRNVYELFASEGIPRVYINDRDGIIRYIHTDDPVPSYDDLKSEIGFLIR